jgi:undecaprenyl-diphosphatase
MTILHALFLGILEGLTEFLPISSTFHLLIATKLLGLPQTEFSKFFDVFIQAGAILAVFVLYWKEWFFNFDLLKKVAVSFIPTAIIGFVMHEVIKGVFFESFGLMTAVFTVVGVIFLLLERMFSSQPEKLAKELTEVTWKQAVIIGTAQAAAILPGVSRAGAVMIGMMLLGYRRDEAAKYSFTLAVPTILAAALLDVIKMGDSFGQITSAEWIFLLAGSVTAFLSALMVMKWFIRFLKQKTFAVFGWYRVIAGPLLFFATR